ncbi:MAG: hypothetical protein PVH24_06110, partial [Candidatus Zixiibacteriota bacterium]
MLDKIKWFWKYYRRHKYVLFVLVFLTPIQSAFQVTVPRMIGFTVDYLKNKVVPDNALATAVADAGGHLGLSPTAAFGLAFMVFGLLASMVYTFVQSHRAWMNLKL